MFSLLSNAKKQVIWYPITIKSSFAFFWTEMLNLSVPTLDSNSDPIQI